MIRHLTRAELDNPCQAEMTILFGEDCIVLFIKGRMLIQTSLEALEKRSVDACRDMSVKYQPMPHQTARKVGGEEKRGE